MEYVSHSKKKSLKGYMKLDSYLFMSFLHQFSYGKSNVILVECNFPNF